MPPFWDIATLTALIAAPVVGSFLGTVVRRLPAGRPVAAGHSRCDSCDARLTVRDLVPVMSWLLLRGRCRHCGAAVSAFYPGIELAALAVPLWALAAGVHDPVALWISCGLGWALLTLAAIDIGHLWLPDVITIPLIAAGLAASVWLAPGSGIDHAGGAAAGFAALFFVNRMYRNLRGRDGLGLGDTKLFAAAGAWLGWEALPAVLLIAAVAALLAALIGAARGRRLDPATPLPFGPFLALGLWLTWLHGPLISLSA